MIKKTVEVNSTRVDGKTFLNLIEAVGWSNNSVLTIKELSSALQKTSCHFSVWQGDKLIGIARVFTDEYLFSVIPEILIHPNFQGKGLGRAMMKKIIKKYGRTIIFLGAQRGKEGFFEKMGFIKGPAGYEKLFFPKKSK